MLYDAGFDQVSLHCNNVLCVNHNYGPTCLLYLLLCLCFFYFTNSYSASEIYLSFIAYMYFV